MTKIVGIIRPFDMVQHFFVYENDKKLMAFDTTIKDISETVLALAKDFQTNTVDLTGPKGYLAHIKDTIKELEITKYNKNNLIINLI